MAKIKTKTHSGAKKQTDPEGHQAEENRSYRWYC